jgi:hypothetical protein
VALIEPVKALPRVGKVVRKPLPNLAAAGIDKKRAAGMGDSHSLVVPWVTVPSVMPVVLSPLLGPARPGGFLFQNMEVASRFGMIFTEALSGSAFGFCMAIYRLIAKGTFGPEEIEAMTAAYEAALVDLGLVDRDDPITEIVATAIVSVSSRGERDPVVIKDRALNAIGVRRLNDSAA